MLSRVFFYLFGLISSVSQKSVLFQDLSTYYYAKTLFLILFLVYSFLNFLRNGFCEKKLLLYFGNITRIYSSIFKEEFIFTVEELRVIFFLNESHFRLNCCLSFFNLTIFLYNLPSLRLFFLEAVPRFGNCRDIIIGEKFLPVSTVA